MKSDEPPAFPGRKGLGFDEGMTLRYYFAGQAIIGFTANFGCNSWNSEKTAETAYKYADAMLKARKK